MSPEAGVTFPAGNVGALVDAVDSLLADEPRRRTLGEGARRIALEKYSWDDVARRLVGIYERVAA
jgi:glycosyltransferase involved in cell wall biosynthesis